MDSKTLPPAKLNQQNVKFGKSLFRIERPTQTFGDAKKGLDNLERAAKQKIFNEPSE